MSDYEEIDPLANPGLTNSLIQQVIGGDDSDEATPPPLIANPRDGFVTLPGGVVVDGKTITEVEVQELTGAHEERIAKSRTATDPGKFVSTVLRCGITAIGEDESGDLVDELLIGDRDFLMLEIRKATYGPEIEFGSEPCPECGDVFDMVGDLNTVPVQRLDRSSDREFEVTLRKGGSATVRLPNGEDQRAFMEDLSLTLAERNTLLLTRTVSYVTHPHGEMEDVAAFPSIVRNLGLMDRRKILEAIAERMPGPRYDEFVIEHDCGAKIPAPIGMMSLFPGL